MFSSANEFDDLKGRTGQGLPITNVLVKKMRMEITYEASPWKGTIFFILLLVLLANQKCTVKLRQMKIQV